MSMNITNNSWRIARLAPLLFAAQSVLADTIAVDCDQGETITNALAGAAAGDTVLISGTCNESVAVTIDHITLDGQGSATITAGFAPGVSVDGAQGVVVQGLTLQGSLFGLEVSSQGSASLVDTTSQFNIVIGARVTGGSSLLLENATLSGNDTFGLEVSRASEVRMTGTIAIANNGLFGVNLADASSLSVAEADVRVSGNVLGIQISVGSSAFLTDAQSVVNTSDNDTTGFTVNSGSTLFLFASTLISSRNAENHGLSVSSNSSVDLDRDARIIVRRNGEDGIRLENSHLNMFTMEDTAGPRVQAVDNARHGVSAFLASSIDLTFDSAIEASGNGDAGLFVDNGSPVRILNSDFTGNSRDVVLEFGARAELNDNTIGTFSCDGSVLVRGNMGLTCPAP